MAGTAIRTAFAAVVAVVAAGAGLAADDGGPAKNRFGAAAGPAPGAPSAIGGYARGCLAGAAALPEDGPGWQTMRPSRNRAWGHPETVAFVGRLGEAALALGWPGVLVGDVSQPRGGPMTSGHASHQVGLDVDIWLMRPDAARLSRSERESRSAVNKVAPDRRRMAASWTDDHARLIRAAAQDPSVARIFVNAAIKAELCRWAPAGDREWLRSVRPWWGHDHHFHVRLKCPAGSPSCEDQAPPPAGDGCDATLDWWFSDEALNPPPPKEPPKPRPPLSMADLPPACAAVASAP